MIGIDSPWGISRMRRHTSRPLMPGISTSRKTRSGRLAQEHFQCLGPVCEASTTAHVLGFQALPGEQPNVLVVVADQNFRQLARLCWWMDMVRQG